MTTTSNPLAARLTGALLSVIRHADLPTAERLALLSALQNAHRDFPCLMSSEWLLACEQLRQTILRERDELYEADRFNEERERFGDLDGDHRWERAERGPEHEYPG